MAYPNYSNPGPTWGNGAPNSNPQMQAAPRQVPNRMGTPGIGNVKAALDQMARDIGAYANGNADAYARQMYASNPAFRELADRVQGMTPEQAYMSELSNTPIASVMPPAMLRQMLPF